LLGQREHLLIILTLPYLVLLTSRFTDRPCVTSKAFAIGLLGVLGFALKPYFLIVPVALEIYLMIKHRSLVTWLRPENLGLGAGGALMRSSCICFTRST
jgi:hypothetical protein